MFSKSYILHLSLQNNILLETHFLKIKQAQDNTVIQQYLNLTSSAKYLETPSLPRRVCLPSLLKLGRSLLSLNMESNVHQTSTPTGAGKQPFCLWSGKFDFFFRLKSKIKKNGVGKGDMGLITGLTCTLGTRTGCLCK